MEKKNSPQDCTFHFCVHSGSKCIQCHYSQTGQEQQRMNILSPLNGKYLVFTNKKGNIQGKPTFMFLKRLQKTFANLPRLELPFAIVIVFSYMFFIEFGGVELPSKDTGHLFSVKSN